MRNAILIILAFPLIACHGHGAVTNDPPTTLWDRSTLFGDLGGLRPRAEAYGITFIPVYTGEIMGELAGHHSGDRVIYANNVALPLDIDLEKCVGWHDALFHANAFWIAGRGLTEDSISDLANVSNITGYRTVRLSELWLQQSFWDKRVSIKAGLVAVDTEFFANDAADLFISSSFGTFSLIAANLPDPPIYPEAAPAVRVAFQASPNWGFQAAIFDGDSGAQDVNKNGIDFHLARGDGALVFSEISFQPSPETDEPTLADAFKLGAFFHSARRPTWTDRIGGSDSGGSEDFGIYGVAQQDLFKHDKKKITAFMRGGGAPANRNVIGWYIDTGLNFTGFLSGRDDDIAGIAFARSSFSRGYSDFRQVTDGTRPFGSETIIEATYKAQLTPWWMLQPDLQIIFTPGGQKDARQAIVLGMRTAISF